MSIQGERPEFKFAAYDKVDPVVHANIIESEESNEAVYAATTPKSRFSTYYRSTLCNVILVGLISFTQPGIWSALNNTGAGGQQEPYLVNGSTAIIFGIMTFGCPVFSVLANKFGLKNMLIVGTLGAAPYSAALYMNNRYGVEWFVLFGAVTCGISAAALWSTEGAIAIGYPEVHKRGIYAGIWLALRELGQILGASIQLSLNHRLSQRGKVGYNTYLVLIGIQCVGLPLALLVSPPHKAIRADGSRVTNIGPSGPILQELKNMWRIFQEKRMYLLAPILMTFQWNSTYQGIYLTKYFSVRARTLGSLGAGIAAAMADFFWGWFLDLKVLGRPRAARITTVLFSVVMLGLFGWQIANEDLYSRENASIDWTSPGFGRALAVNTLFRFMNESSIVLVFWLVGTFNSDIRTITLSVGILMAFESLGSTISNGLGAARIPPMTNLIVSFAVFVCSVPPTLIVAWMVPEQPRGQESLPSCNDQVR